VEQSSVNGTKICFRKLENEEIEAPYELPDGGSGIWQRYSHTDWTLLRKV
jgi:hypothetical protein